MIHVVGGNAAKSCQHAYSLLIGCEYFRCMMRHFSPSICMCMRNVHTFELSLYLHNRRCHTTHTAASCGTCSAAARKGSYPWQSLPKACCRYRGQNHKMVNTNATPIFLISSIPSNDILQQICFCQANGFVVSINSSFAIVRR